MNAQTLQAKEILAQNLKEYRLYFKLSQAEMAQQVHMSFRGYGKLERFEVSASLDTVDKVAEYLGLSPAILMCPHMIGFIADQKPHLPQKTRKPRKKKEKAMEGVEETTTSMPVECEQDTTDSMPVAESSEETVESAETPVELKDNPMDIEE